MRIAIVEDHAMFLGFLRKLCKDELRFEVVGAVKTGREGIELCRARHPDVVLLDLDLPDGDGLDMVSDFKTASPRSRIIAVSALTDEYTMARVMDAGLDGFVDKQKSPEEKLAEAIRTVMSGGSYFAPVVSEVRRKIQGDPKSPFKRLSPHELDVLSDIARGLSNMETGRRLGLCESTVKTHQRNIMDKLGLHSTPKLIWFALRKGIARLRPGPSDT